MFLRILFLFCFLNIVNSRKQTHSTGCYLPYTDFPDKEPVFLDLSKKLIPPRGQGIHLNRNDRVIISCPGHSNAFELFPDHKSLDVRCGGKEILLIDNNPYEMSQLSCQDHVSGEVKNASTPCGNGRGRKEMIGHTVMGEFKELFAVCYNERKLESVYAEHIVHGSGIKYGKKDKERPGFKKVGLPKNTPIEKAYQINTQDETLKKILHHDYINQTSYLAKGHLAPNADFVYISSRWSTYFYINVVPQWQQINNGNWKKLEFIIRNTAANLNIDLGIFTGGFGNLTLVDKNNNQKVISLMGNRLSAPKYMWKVVYAPNSNAIAFVTVNNPFGPILEDDLLGCKDICDDYNWDLPERRVVRKGFTYCCSVALLRKRITDIPNIKVKNILRGNNTVFYRSLMHE